MRSPLPQILYVAFLFLVAVVLCLFILPAAARDGERMAESRGVGGFRRSLYASSFSLFGPPAADVSSGGSSPCLVTASEQIAKP